MFVRTVVLVAVASGLFGCAQPPTPADSQGAAASAARGAADIPSAGARSGKPENRAMYRLDFTFASTEAGKPTTTTAYTLNLEEHSKGEINLGRNVPLQVNPAASGSAAPGASAAGSAPARFGTPRQDVGFLLRCSFTSSGEDLLLDSLVEMSGVDPTPDARGVHSIQKLNLKGNALVTPGKTAVVSSSEDPATHQRYQLSVTATKLR
jgi:hypothetical protein